MSLLRYRPEIDGLRALAVLPVLVYHARLPLGESYWLPGGFLGVDVFFVISGYLITGLILREYDRKGRFPYTNFYLRRIRRLLPILLLVLLCCLPLAWFLLMPTPLEDFSRSLLASIGFVSNLYWHQELNNYGGADALARPLLHTWSLAVEEQFYLLYPMGLVLLLKLKRSWLYPLLTVAMLVSFGFCLWSTEALGNFSFYWLPPRAWELLAGGLLALHHTNGQARTLTLRGWGPLLGLVLIIGSYGLLPFGDWHPGLPTLLPVLGSLLYIAGAGGNDVVSRVMCARPVVAVGLVSYSLYLWHYPIFAFARIADGEPSGMEWLGLFALSGLLTALGYFLVERPFRDFKRVSNALLLTALGLSAVVVTSAAIWFISQEGLPERMTKLEAVYGDSDWDNDRLRRQSWKPLRDRARKAGVSPSQPWQRSVFESQRLWFDAQATGHKMLIIGDSHSKDLYNAMALNPESFGHLQVARHAINPRFPSGWEAILETPNFREADTLIVIFRYYDDMLPDLFKALQLLNAQGKKLIVISQAAEFAPIGGRPIFDFAVQRRPGLTGGELKALFHSHLSASAPGINQRVKKMGEKLDLQVLDRLALICPAQQDYCHGVTDTGKKALYDSAHWTLDGARYYGRLMAEAGWFSTND